MPAGGNSSAAAHQHDEKNPVLQLNDIRKDCVYELKQESGPSHEKRFTFKLTIDGKTFDGSGPTKKAAKAAAATKALKHPAVNVNASKYKAQQQAQRQKNPNQNKPPAAYTKKVPKGNQDDAIQYINGKQVCRFYLNSLCLRGKNCPYLHPEYSSQQNRKLPVNPQVPATDSYSWLQFCHNYVHLRCPRSDCKFLHVSKDDEELYRTTGKIPPHVVEQAVRKAMAEDVAPPGVTQTCKAYLEGQCSWYSCPFRHLSRQEFSQEVLEALLKHFEMRLRPKEDYRLLSSRLLDPPSTLMDREAYGYNPRNVELSRRVLDERPLNYESRYADRRDYERYRPLSGESDWLVNGMQNLMRDDDFRHQKKLDDLREELRKLHEENERLRNSVRLRSVEEENYFRLGLPQERGLPRSDFIKGESIYQDKVRTLKEENEEIRRMLLSRERERQYPIHQSDRRSYGKPMYGDSYYPDVRSEMRRQKPESYNFDELLDSGMKRMEGQIVYQQRGMGLPLTSPKYLMPQKLGQQKVSKQAKQVYKYPNNIKKPGQNIQTATRPSYQVKYKINTNQFKKVTQQPYPKVYQKKPKQQNPKTPPQPKQQKQKTPPQQKQQNQNAKKTTKEKPVVTVKETKQNSQSKEQRERKPRKPTNENAVENNRSVKEESSNDVVENNASVGEKSSDDDVIIEEEVAVNGEEESRESEPSERDNEENEETKEEEGNSDASEEHVQSIKDEEDKSKITTTETEEKSAGASDRWVDAPDDVY